MPSTEECHALAAQVSKLKVDKPPVRDEFFSGITFTLCNENYTRHDIPGLLHAEPVKDDSVINIAIVLGQSCLPFILSKMMHLVDVIIVYDINPTLFEQIKFLCRILRESNNGADFLQRYRKGIAGAIHSVTVTEQQTQSLSELIAIQMKEMGIMGDDGAFLKCKAALEEIQIAYFHADISSTTHCQQLCSLLYTDPWQCRVRLINLTNIEEYAKKEKVQKRIQENINLLFRGNPAPILLYSYLRYPEDTLLGGRSEYLTCLSHDPRISRCVKKQPSIWDTAMGKYLSGQDTLEDRLTIACAATGWSSEESYREILQSLGVAPGDGEIPELDTTPNTTEGNESVTTLPDDPGQSNDISDVSVSFTNPNI